MKTVEPISLSTIWYAFQSLCREMRAMVTRTSQSYLISALKDLSVGVWLADAVFVPVDARVPAGERDRIVAELDCIGHLLFVDQVRTGFNHHDGIGRPRDHKIKSAPLQLRKRRIEHELVVD